jgi:hypothetical protein
LEKSGQLLVYILTKGRQIIVIKLHRIVEVFQWNEMIPLFDDYSFFLQQILEDEDIVPPVSE